MCAYKGGVLISECHAPISEKSLDLHQLDHVFAGERVSKGSTRCAHDRGFDFRGRIVAWNLRNQHGAGWVDDENPEPVFCSLEDDLIDVVIGEAVTDDHKPRIGEVKSPSELIVIGSENWLLVDFRLFVSS